VGNLAAETLSWLESRNPDQPEFQQAAREIVHDVETLVDESTEYREAKVLERLLEPDRVLSFRVVWEKDSGELAVNRGYRVQTSNALGPYKGGLRFHPSVNESIFKFLGLEQTLKNSLTNLPIGSGKGGADFNPKDASDSEIRRFCQAFMSELVHHIGPETDVPAGDIGVGAREVGYLFGRYKQLRRSFDGVLTGKPLGFGGSELRVEATGFGVVHFADAALAFADEKLSGRRCAVSGAGNVARYCALKLLEQDCAVISLSNSRGVLVAEDGLSRSLVERLADNSAGLEELAEEFGYEFREEGKPWELECELAFPCATQNELTEDDAKLLTENGCGWVVEGANMPCTQEAIDLFRDRGVTVCPGKAANAGGVVVSALEMSQNAYFQRWSRGEVEKLLKQTMEAIHDRCAKHLDEDERDYVRAANRAGFVPVAEALVAQGA
jgi:glutamate dehydrogenase (NADP+)